MCFNPPMNARNILYPRFHDLRTTRKKAPSSARNKKNSTVYHAAEAGKPRTLINCDAASVSPFSLLRVVFGSAKAQMACSSSALRLRMVYSSKPRRRLRRTARTSSGTTPVRSVRMESTCRPCAPPTTVSAVCQRSPPAPPMTGRHGIGPSYHAPSAGSRRLTTSWGTPRTR